ncbi:MAG: 4Fe-4S binding protein [Pseudomonadota bacterium]
MKRQARKPFDHSKIPNDLCPIATTYSELKTGDWRAERPVVRREKCVKCATCWVYCPTQCIVEKPTCFEADLEICKGCGICAQECPHGAIMMFEEAEEA